ncbi:MULTISPECIES: hypothetical protein [unclassified Lysinibacillus]|uniref:hypothetical protein n=1 Tax=unclassified Lysinibacillus TaxID=2636778 RepID=UPI001F0FAD4C|nr:MULTISPECIES: hypothetical protein [unclassified Lysinibacillus]
MEEKLKKEPGKRIQLVDVVLERSGSQMFSGKISCTGCTNNPDNLIQFMKIHGVR